MSDQILIGLDGRTEGASALEHAAWLAIQLCGQGTAVTLASVNVDTIERARVVEAVRVDLGPTLNTHSVDGILQMPTSTHIATVRV